MKFYIGKNSGFCFGVGRAVKTAFSLKGDNNYILGEIIHNESVNNALEDKGVKTIISLNNVSLSDKDTVLIRTHGEKKDVYDTLNSLRVNIVDCTCPFVQNIHKIVKEHYNKGYKIVIIGDKKHPEIVGINGWCNNSALITESPDEINAIISEKLCIVSQTTFSEKKFDEIIKKIDNSNVKSVDIFKTICYTTLRRQIEVEIISKKSDAVVVIGGSKSNNTNNLYLISKKYCTNVFRIIDTKNFDYEKIKNYKNVGIVLGASTPISQAQEVIQNMEKITEEITTTEVIESEVKPEVATEKVVKSEMQAAFENIRPNKDYKKGQIVVAKISSVKDIGLTVSIKNVKNDFILPKEELLSDSVDAYKVGDEIRVMVIGKAPLKFSEKAMQKVLLEEAEIEEIKNGKIFEAVITEVNKGGLIGKFGSYQVFVPSSQIKLGFVKDLSKYVGKTLRLKAEKVEAKGPRRQIVGSQKVILEAEKQERDAIKAAKEAEFFESIQEGDVVLGVPVRFTNFGAFIDVNGFDCLAHISDLSWIGCTNCADVLEIGKSYEFKILKIDSDAKRVSVGYKQLQDKPWDLVPTKYQVNDVVKGIVVRLVNFGAFVEIEKGVDGLVHVTQISHEFIKNPSDALQVGQEIEAKILNINLEKERMTLSIKALLPAPVKPARETKPEEVVEDDLHEWKDEDDSTVSIAEIIGTDN
jgi:4-hydroxy-3-methylbut-2-enyl diphosphate reductase